jgi:hypothetical protein
VAKLLFCFIRQDYFIGRTIFSFVLFFHREVREDTKVFLCSVDSLLG